MDTKKAKEACQSIADYLVKDRKENPEKYVYNPNAKRQLCLTMLLNERHEEEQQALKDESL
jgi:hypothetical protein